MCLLLQIVSRSQYRGRIEDQLKEGIKEIKRIERRNDIPESISDNVSWDSTRGMTLNQMHDVRGELDRMRDTLSITARQNNKE